MSAHIDEMRRIRRELQTVDRWSTATDPRDLPRPAVRYIPDAAQRQDIVAAVRNAMPGCDAVTGLRAARTTAGLRNDPFYRDAVHAYLERVVGDVDAVTAPIPDAFTARVHTSRVTRSRKGRTSFKVDRRGIAQVVGSTSYITAPFDVDAVDGLSDTERGWLTASLDLIPLKRCGRSSLRVLRVTDYRLGAYGVPPVLGTDLTAFASMVDADVSDRSECAVQRSSLSGESVPVGLDRFVADGAPTSARRTARFAVSRRRLSGLRARLSDPSTVATVKVGKDGKERTTARFVPTVDVVLATPSTYTRNALGYASCFVRRERLVATYDRAVVRSTVDVVTTYPDRHIGRWSHGEWHAVTLPGRTVTRERDVIGAAAPERLWLGHALITRDAPKSRGDRSTSDALAARTIGTVDAPCSEHAWEVLADAVNRGERVAVRFDGVSRVRYLSRATDGRYALTLPDGRRLRERSASALALRCA